MNLRSKGTNRPPASSIASSSEQSLVGASGYKFKDGEGQKKGVKIRLKAKPPVARQNSDMNGTPGCPHNTSLYKVSETVKIPGDHD